MKPAKPFNAVEVYAYFWDQTGTAWFDALRLEAGASHTSLTYDAGGNYLTEIADPLGNKVTYTYDAAGNRTSVRDGKGHTTNTTTPTA